MSVNLAAEQLVPFGADHVEHDNNITGFCGGKMVRCSRFVGHYFGDGSPLQRATGHDCSIRIGDYESGSMRQRDTIREHLGDGVKLNSLSLLLKIHLAHGVSVCVQCGDRL